jgi:N-ethylmaleimide reductase
LHDDNPGETFAALLQAATPLNLAYLHLIYVPALPVDGLQLAQQNYRGAMIINESLTLESAQRYIENGTAAAASFGRFYISNPDLVERFRRGAELVQPDRNTMYTPGPKGYTDYPFLP